MSAISGLEIDDTASPEAARKNEYMNGGDDDDHQLGQTNDSLEM